MIVDRLLRRLVKRVIDLHYCRLVSTSVAIVRRRKDSHYSSVVLPLISFHDKLVCSSNKVKTI